MTSQGSFFDRSTPDLFASPADAALPAGFRPIPGHAPRLLCDACGHARPLRADTAGHREAHLRARVLALRFGQGYVPVYLTIAQYVIDRRGTDAVHDPFGMVSAPFVGLPATTEGHGAGLEGFPWSLHWTHRDIAEEMLAALPATAMMTRVWFAVLLRALDAHAATGAPPWLACVAAVRHVRPTIGGRVAADGLAWGLLPFWLLPSSGVRDLPEVVAQGAEINAALDRLRAPATVTAPGGA